MGERGWGGFDNHVLAVTVKYQYLWRLISKTSGTASADGANGSVCRRDDVRAAVNIAHTRSPEGLDSG